MRDWLGRRRPEDWWLAILGAVAVIGGIAIIRHWWDDTAVVFGGLQALFALLAFVAAAAAFKATWPQYRAFTAAPEIRLRLEWAEQAELPPEPVPARPEFKGNSFVVRVVIDNGGPGLFRGMLLNIVVPSTCWIEPIDPDPKIHYLSPMMSRNAEMVLGGTEVMLVRFTVARGDISPGAHVFHARVTPMGRMKGPVHVLVDLNGDPPPPVSEHLRRAAFYRAGSLPQPGPAG